MKGRNLQKSQRQKKYNASVKGIARQFRSNYGYNHEDSLMISRKCVSDYQRCEICGLPGWFNKIIRRKGGPFLRGDERVNRRLVPDHIIPGGSSTIENTRILCFGCNHIRGAGLFSDVEVLRIATRWYEYMFPQKFLFWLNRPDKSGTLFKSYFMQQKELRLLGQRGLDYLSNLKIKIGDMTPGSAAPLNEGEQIVKFL